MNLLHYLRYAFQEYTAEKLLLKLEREIEKLREPVLSGSVIAARRLIKILEVKDELK